MRVRIFLVWYMLCGAALVFGQTQIGMSGVIEWNKMEINATVSLNLASADLKLPAGRTQSEALITNEYLRLIRPNILNLQVDSSSVIADLVRRGEWELADIEHLALEARTVPPALSPDFASLLGFYTLDIGGISASLIRHQRQAEPPRTLSPVAAPDYTGIVIIASENLPIHGMKSVTLIRPCLFPKIWDTEMNLIFERNMLTPRTRTMARYFPLQGIFSGGPSGLSPEASAVVGSRPLRIFARGVFGVQPTDPIISREDALLIISTETNRNLLHEGRVVIILDDHMLGSEFINQ